MLLLSLQFITIYKEYYTKKKHKHHIQRTERLSIKLSNMHGEVNDLKNDIEKVCIEVTYYVCVCPMKSK